MDNIGSVAGKMLAEADTRASQASRSRALAKQAKLTADGLPVFFDGEVDVAIPGRLICFRPDHGPVEIRRPMEAVERGAVEARAAALEIALAPFSVEEKPQLEASVGAMFAGFRSMRQQGEDIESTVAITLAVLREFPAWAITKVCLKIARHEAGFDQRFAPNDAELASAVSKIIDPYRRNLRQARQLLDAVVDSPRQSRTSARYVDQDRPRQRESNYKTPSDDELRASLARVAGVKPTDEIIEGEA
jgi:hypothetical protein